MTDRLRIEIDTGAVLQALDRLGTAAERYLLEAAHETAKAIAREAGARVRRRTGRTARGITVEVARRGLGYVVFVANPDQPGLAGWLEFGTRAMTAKPFLFAAARLEEGAHDRRIRDAIQRAIEEV